MLDKNWIRLIRNLQSRVGDLSRSLILLQGSNEVSINDQDNAYPIQQEANFTYLFGQVPINLDGFLIPNKNEAYVIADWAIPEFLKE